MLLLTAGTLILWTGIMAAGVILGQLLTQFNTSWRDIPWVEIFRGVMLTSVAAWLIVAIHTWVSLRWRSFTVAVGFGMSATVIGFLLAQSDKWGKFYPWSLPANTFAGGEKYVIRSCFQYNKLHNCGQSRVLGNGTPRCFIKQVILTIAFGKPTWFMRPLTGNAEICSIT